MNSSENVMQFRFRMSYESPGHSSFSLQRMAQTSRDRCENSLPAAGRLSGQPRSGMLNSMEKDLSATEGGLSNEHGLAVDVHRVLT